MAACTQCFEVLAPRARFCGRCGAPQADDEAEESGDSWLGRLVDGRYRVVSRIGSGGMGVVYRVEHLHLGKMAAMKVLAPETAAKPEMLRRFRNEAQAVSKLDHPNIVQTFDFGHADGALYLVMELVNGEDLSALLRREGPWTFARAARLFVQVCSGLADAHAAGIVHRDLKPENLMVVRRRDGTEHVKVLDFGLAKLRERAFHSDASVPNATGSNALGASSTGQVLGTPYYMAPEQVRGEPLDGRADLYGVGATLYRVLTGEPPFEALSPMGVLAKHLTDDLIPPRERAPGRFLPPEADRIVLRAMAKAPSDRYGSASELQADLEQALAELAGGWSSSSLPPPIRPPAVTGSANALTVAIEDSDIIDEAGDRLRRADVDEFEWALRRRRLVTRLVVPIFAVAALAGAAAWVARALGDRADSVEHEPNNTPGYANLLAVGAPVRGTIGKLDEAGRGDVDFFRVPAGKGARVVDVRLEGVPGIDLVLELYDAQGRRVAKSDEHGRGWGEWLQPTSIGPTEAYLAVRELWVQGRKPSADVLEPYTLTARWGLPRPGWEVEPNDWPAAATPVAAPGRLRGYLGSAEDRDWFAISVDRPAGATVMVTAPAGVDVILLRDPDGRRPIDKRGAGGSEELAADLVPGQPFLVGVARKPLRAGDPKDQPMVGLEDSYELAVALVTE